MWGNWVALHSSIRWPRSDPTFVNVLIGRLSTIKQRSHSLRYPYAIGFSLAATENSPYAYVDPDGRDPEATQTVTITARRPSLIIWIESRPSKPVDPLLKPWVGQSVRGAQAGSPDWEPAADDDDPRGRSRGSRSHTDRPTRISSPKHHKNSVSPEPKNVEKLYENSVVDKTGVRWEKDTAGTIHRFSRPSNGETHWNGSTAALTQLVSEYTT